MVLVPFIKRLSAIINSLNGIHTETNKTPTSNQETKEKKELKKEIIKKIIQNIENLIVCLEAFENKLYLRPLTLADYSLLHLELYVITNNYIHLYLYLKDNTENTQPNAELQKTAEELFRIYQTLAHKLAESLFHLYLEAILEKVEQLYAQAFQTKWLNLPLQNLKPNASFEENLQFRLYACFAQAKASLQITPFLLQALEAEIARNSKLKNQLQDLLKYFPELPPTTLSTLLMDSIQPAVVQTKEFSISKFIQGTFQEINSRLEHSKFCASFKGVQQRSYQATKQILYPLFASSFQNCLNLVFVWGKNVARNPELFINIHNGVTHTNTDNTDLKNIKEEKLKTNPSPNVSCSTNSSKTSDENLEAIQKKQFPPQLNLRQYYRADNPFTPEYLQAKLVYPDLIRDEPVHVFKPECSGSLIAKAVLDFAPAAKLFAAEKTDTAFSVKNASKLSVNILCVTLIPEKKDSAEKMITNHSFGIAVIFHPPSQKLYLAYEDLYWGGAVFTCPKQFSEWLHQHFQKLGYDCFKSFAINNIDNLLTHPKVNKFNDSSLHSSFNVPQDKPRKVSNQKR